MNGFDPMMAINMPEQQGFWSKALGALSGAGREMTARPEKTAIALDMLGRGFDPKNPFAGIGTALGKSSLAGKAEAAGQEKSMAMFNRMLEALTAKDKQGPTSMLASLSPDGKGIDYKISGMEGLETSTKMPGVETPKILTDKDFVSQFGGDF